MPDPRDAGGRVGKGRKGGCGERLIGVILHILAKTLVGADFTAVGAQAAFGIGKFDAAVCEKREKFPISLQGVGVDVSDAHFCRKEQC